MFDVGALTTMTPRSVAAGTSTLSSPMPARATTFRFGAAASASASIWVALRIITAAASARAGQQRRAVGAVDVPDLDVGRRAPPGRSGRALRRSGRRAWSWSQGAQRRHAGRTRTAGVQRSHWPDARDRRGLPRPRCGVLPAPRAAARSWGWTPVPPARAEETMSNDRDDAGAVRRRPPSTSRWAGRRTRGSRRRRTASSTDRITASRSTGAQYGQPSYPAQYPQQWAAPRRPASLRHGALGEGTLRSGHSRPVPAR